MANSEIITLVYIRQAKKKKKSRVAGQIGCQATGNCPGSPDGQSAPDHHTTTTIIIYIALFTMQIVSKQLYSIKQGNSVSNYDVSNWELLAIKSALKERQHPHCLNRPSKLEIP